MAAAVGSLSSSFSGATAALQSGSSSRQQNARRQCRLAVVAQAGQQGEQVGFVVGEAGTCWPLCTSTDWGVALKLPQTR